MARRAWNHNLQYYDLVLEAVPSPCLQALDVGCGRGELARRLAERCEQVIGVDVDAATLAAAAKRQPGIANLTFRCVDVMSEEFAEGSFDFVTVVAALHHLPLYAALERLRDSLQPGGTLAVIGLYRARTVRDFAMFPLSFTASLLFRSIYKLSKVGAPTREPEATLLEIRKAAKELMPGAVLRRRLFSRYSLVWRKPASLAG